MSARRKRQLPFNLGLGRRVSGWIYFCRQPLQPHQNDEGKARAQNCNGEKKPNPQATPTAPASHMLAPVVRPEICTRDWMMVPAARNATPAVTASMARRGSAV